VGGYIYCIPGLNMGSGRDLSVRCVADAVARAVPWGNELYRLAFLATPMKFCNGSLSLLLFMELIRIVSFLFI
jgi:hypothetical protein